MSQIQNEHNPTTSTIIKIYSINIVKKCVTINIFVSVIDNELRKPIVYQITVIAYY